MTTHFVSEEGFSGAIALLSKKGGQLFPGRDYNSATVVMCGKECYTFWEPDSQTRKHVRTAAMRYGYDPEIATSGRISRWLLRDVVELPEIDAQAHPRFKSLAESGHHWHYTKCIEGYHPYLLEFDIRSAYMSSVLQGDTLLYDYERGYLDDHGAIFRLAALCADLPKFLRMSLIGSLCAHKMVFGYLSREAKDLGRLKYKTIHKINDALSFQACHKGVLRLWRIMQEGDAILGDWCKRIHTDSFAIDPDLPQETEDRFFEYLQAQGLSYSCKAQGPAHFLGLNEGIIGKSLIGVVAEVVPRLRELRPDLERRTLTEDESQRWENRVSEGLWDPTELNHQNSLEDRQGELQLGLHPYQVPQSMAH